MAIKFRHDAAGVVLPSNESNRKYGQSLVLQQQQQKYRGQQAGLDRLFDATRQQNQNLFQMGRDQQQKNFQWDMGQAQNQFQEGRDKARFDQQQQVAEAERQRAFLEDARRQTGGAIADSIKNGEYDPSTARKLQQNLVAEAEALGNPQLDATQRAEVLEKIRAERIVLSANRIEPTPELSPQQQFDQGIVVGPDGTKYRPNSKGDFEPLPTQQQQPTTAQEYYSANEDKFQKDLSATMQSMQDEVFAGTRTEEVTPEAAWEQMQQDFEFRQKALGRSSPAGATPAAPSAAGQVPPAQSPAGIPVAPPDPGRPPAPQVPQSSGIPVAAPDPGQPPSPAQGRKPLPLTSNSSSQNPWAELSGVERRLQPPADTQAPPASAAEYDAQMKAKGYKLVTPADGGRPYYLGDWGASDAGPPTRQPPVKPLDGSRPSHLQDAPTGPLFGEGRDSVPAGPLQGEGPAPAPGSRDLSNALVDEQATAAGNGGQSGLPKVAPPDFGKLVGSATDDNDKAVISQIQGLVSQHADSPDVVNALHVFVSPGSTKEDRLAAFDYLSTAGIDLNQMIAEEPSRAEKMKAIQEANEKRFGNRRDLQHGF